MLNPTKIKEGIPMTKKLLRCASLLPWTGSLFLLFAALRADGDLGFWLPPALTGILLAAFGIISNKGGKDK